MAKTVTTNYSGVAAPGNTFNRRISADADIFERNDADALGNALELHTHANGLGLPVNTIPSGGLTVTSGGITVSTGGGTIQPGLGVGTAGNPATGILIGGATPAGVGSTLALGITNAAAAGGGATATFGSAGGSGPAAAAQNGWLKIAIGTQVAFIPFWI